MKQEPPEELRALGAAVRCCLVFSRTGKIPEVKSTGKAQGFQCYKLRKHSHRSKHKLLLLQDNLNFNA